MSMQNRENFKFKLSAYDQQKKKPCNLKPMTFDRLMKWIDKQPIDPMVKEELKKSASGYPSCAYDTWIKNFHKHLLTAQNKVKDKKAMLPDDFFDKEPENDKPISDSVADALARYENPGED